MNAEQEKRCLSFLTLRRYPDTQNADVISYINSLSAAGYSDNDILHADTRELAELLMKIDALKGTRNRKYRIMCLNRYVTFLQYQIPAEATV